MTSRLHALPPTSDDRAIRRTWRLLSVSFLLLGILVAARLMGPGAAFADAVAMTLLVVGFGAALANRNAVVAREAGRRLEAESFARIVHGLARSVSPETVIRAIVAELAVSTEADHVVVVRRLPDRDALEATLVTTRAGVPDATAVLPIVDLEDRVRVPEDAVAISIAPVSAGPGRIVTSRATVSDGHSEANGPGSPERIASRIASRVRTVFGLGNLLAAPMIVGGGVIGAIIVARRAAQAWSPSSRRLLVGAAAEAATALTRTEAQRDAEERATTDALTGLPNRRYFDEFCGLIGRRRRSDDTIGILMIDIDRFKRLNDTHGHPVGDEVLRAVGCAIAGAVRDDDVPARYGGEEFAVLLRNPTADIATDVGERVRSAVRALDLRDVGVDAVSVSVGAAVSRSGSQPIAEIVAAADAALYDAKRNGRDRVVAAA